MSGSGQSKDGAVGESIDGRNSQSGELFCNGVSSCSSTTEIKNFKNVFCDGAVAIINCLKMLKIVFFLWCCW